MEKDKHLEIWCTGAYGIKLGIAWIAYPHEAKRKRCAGMIRKVFIGNVWIHILPCMWVNMTAVSANI